MNERRRAKKLSLTIAKIIILIVLFLMCSDIIRSSYAKYSSSATSEASLDLAYYLIKEQSVSQNLKIDSILPRPSPYDYNIYIANYDGDERTETALEYTIIIKTTTNLHLSFAVYKDGNTQTNLVSNSVTTADSDGTFFNIITVTPGTLGFEQDESHTYKLSIGFPEAYNSAQYEGIIEYIQITVNAAQITSSSANASPTPTSSPSATPTATPSETPSVTPDQG